MIYLLPLLLLGASTLDEIEIQGRWKAETLELRVGTGPWVKTHEQLLEQLTAAKAGPETPITLVLDPDIPNDPVVKLQNFLRDRKFSKVEISGVIIVKKPAKAGEREKPRKPPTPLRIEIVHKIEGCRVYAKEPVCPEATHWSIHVDRKPCAGREELLGVLRVEGAKEQDPQMRRVSARPLTIGADRRAPYGLVLEVGVVSEEAGFWRATFDGTADETPKPPDPGADPVPAKDSDKELFSVSIGIRRKDGTPELRVNEDSWTRSEKDWMQQLRSKKAWQTTDLRLDADPDVAWSAVLRIKEMLQDWGFTTFVFMAPGFPLEGPILPDPVTEKEATAWARAVDGDAKAIGRSIYREELERRSMRNVRLTIPMRINVGQLFSGVMPLFSAEEDPLPAWRFLGIQSVNGVARPLFRLLSQARIDYVSFVLGKTADGKVRAVDAFSLLGGELASQTIYSGYFTDPKAMEILNSLKAPTPGDLGMCMGRPGEMMMFMFEGKAKEALEFYDKNAAEFKSNKVAHRLRMNISRMVGGDAYLKALEEFERDLPGDPSHLFLRVERHLVSKDREKAMAAIDALDRVVMEDPFLDVLRANVLVSAGEFGAARKILERPLDREPKLDRAWWSMISVCMAQKDWAATAKYLTAVEKALGIQLADLEDLPDYAGFVKSDEYREWLKSRK